MSAQSQLAQDAYAIFEGELPYLPWAPDGAYRESLLMEHAALINGGTVVPGNPDASELYKRLLGPTEKRRANAARSAPVTLPSRLKLLDSGYWQARPTGRPHPLLTGHLSRPLKNSIPLKRTSCHLNPLTEPTPATSPSRISITPAKRRRFFRNTAKPSTNWSTASHGAPQSSTQSQLTRGKPSSTLIFDTTSGTPTMAGRG